MAKSRLEKEAPQLDMEVAQQILMNVFEADEKKPSQVPLAVLTEYALYRKDRYRFQKGVVLFIMLVFLILPMFFYVPGLEVTKVSEDSARYPVYSLDVDSILPVLSVQARVDDKNTVVYSTGDHLYEVEPTVNGEMKVTVILWNRQSATATVTVENIDTETPKLVSNSTEGGYIHLFLTDEGSGIDYSSIYALTESGFKTEPVSYDEATGEVVIDIPTSPINLFVSDYKENTLQLVISVK